MKFLRPVKFLGRLIRRRAAKIPRSVLAEAAAIAIPITAKPALRKTTAYACLQGCITARREKELGVHPARIVLRPAGFGAWVRERSRGHHKREHRQDGGARQSFRPQFRLSHPTASSFQASVQDGSPKANAGP
jgi:hypothetical protein